jgi:hypothetical protein
MLGIAAPSARKSRGTSVGGLRRDVLFASAVEWGCGAGIAEFLAAVTLLPQQVANFRYSARLFRYSAGPDRIAQ